MQAGGGWCHGGGGKARKALARADIAAKERSGRGPLGRLRPRLRGAEATRTGRRASARDRRGAHRFEAAQNEGSQDGVKAADDGGVERGGALHHACHRQAEPVAKLRARACAEGSTSQMSWHGSRISNSRGTAAARAVALIPLASWNTAWQLDGKDGEETASMEHHSVTLGRQRWKRWQKACRMLR